MARTCHSVRRQNDRAQAESLVEQIASLRPNFLVLDEVQLIKRREHSDASIRREMLESLLTRLPEAHVLGMTATPVINELSKAFRCSKRSPASRRI